jgi:hypothetical protein
MPGGDRTGPTGLGPITGRAAGYCAGFGTPGYGNPALGPGLRMGFGREWGSWGRGFGGGGRGWRHCFHATGLPGWLRSGWGAYPPYHAASAQAAEREYLEDLAKMLQAQLDDVKKRMDSIAGQERKESE